MPQSVQLHQPKRYNSAKPLRAKHATSVKSSTVTLMSHRYHHERFSQHFQRDSEGGPEPQWHPQNHNGTPQWHPQTLHRVLQHSACSTYNQTLFRPYHLSPYHLTCIKPPASAPVPRAGWSLLFVATQEATSHVGKACHSITALCGLLFSRSTATHH